MQADVTFEVGEMPEGQPFVVAPLGDIQWRRDKNAVAVELLKDHVAYCRSQGAWFLSTGDMVDVASPSNRASIQKAKTYDSVDDEFDHAAEDLRLDLVEEVLEETRGRWIAWHEGHHLWEFQDGTTTDTRLAEDLGGTFSGTCSLTEIKFHEGSVVIWAHHGAASNVKHPLNKLENDVFPSWDADIYFLGHTPVISAKVKNRVYKSSRKSGSLGHREGRLVTTGGWAKAYVEGSKRKGVKRGDYAEQAMMAPAALGAPLVRIWPRLVDGAFRPRIRVEL